MVTDLNPQAAQMGHASMVRTLDAQARAIWPQEERLFLRYGLAADIDILDVGCGTGEITLRLAGLYPHASLLGVDLLEGPLTIARSRAMGLGDRVRFAPGDAFALDLPDASVDLAVCRHMLHAVPEPARVLTELRRVTRPGGRLHVIAEDYGMIHAP
ncbi:MAG: methyltransferase domain-containing protein, partial [Gammaproteobacteria bacterium]|nr:methyltransferase domain-containing protein [Gammaproteobacteria bacterium]